MNEYVTHTDVRATTAVTVSTAMVETVEAGAALAAGSSTGVVDAPSSDDQRSFFSSSGRQI